MIHCPPSAQTPSSPREVVRPELFLSRDLVNASALAEEPRERLPKMAARHGSPRVHMEVSTPPRAAGGAYEPNPPINTTPAGAVFMSERPPEDASDEWRDAHSKRRRNFWRDSVAFLAFLVCLVVIVSIGRSVIRFNPEQ